MLAHAELPSACVVMPHQVDICMDKQNPPQPIACPNKRDNRCGNLVLKPLDSQTVRSKTA